jgi:hypothetical protein
MARFRDLRRRDEPRAMLLKKDEEARQGDVLVTEHVKDKDDKRFSVKPRERCEYCNGSGVMTMFGGKLEHCDCIGLVLKNEQERGRV